jgi:hypothetical protein
MWHPYLLGIGDKDAISSCHCYISSQNEEVNMHLVLPVTKNDSNNLALSTDSFYFIVCSHHLAILPNSTSVMP